MGTNMFGITELLVVINIGLILGSSLSEGNLQVGFYSSTCPRAESVVRSTVQQNVQADPTLAAGLLRLHYHDCFVYIRCASYTVFWKNRTPQESITWSLSYNNLTGNIPVELCVNNLMGNISSLQEIDFTDNTLDGSVPSKLGMLSQLLESGDVGQEFSTTDAPNSPEIHAPATEVTDRLVGQMPPISPEFIVRVGNLMAAYQALGPISITISPLGPTLGVVEALVAHDVGVPSTTFADTEPSPSVHRPWLIDSPCRSPVVDKGYMYIRGSTPEKGVDVLYARCRKEGLTEE